MTAVESAVRTPLERALLPGRALPSMPMRDDTVTWTEAELTALRAELGDVYEGRTCLVTGADGFMGSHLTDALVHLGANVIAFVRATSSGALDNISRARRQ